MVTATDSLVKYETAILVSSAFISQKGQDANGGKAKLAPPVDRSSLNKRTEDYLNKILPPQEIIDNSQLWVRYVSATPATEADVLNLKKDLDKKLLSLEARNSGICPVREELHAQCFDELIRQITINCSERGNMLVTIRNEFSMFKDALKQLYDSSIAYGMKKALKADQAKTEMNDRIKTLKKENKELKKRIEELEAESEALVANDKEERERLSTEHAGKKKSLYDQIAVLKIELDKLLTTKVL